MKHSNFRLPGHVPYICGNCLNLNKRACYSSIKSSSQHLYSTRSKSPPVPPTAGFTTLPSRRVISLSGPDSTHYLQGVITANLSSTSNSRSSGFYTAFLNAQGRVLNDVFIYPQIKEGQIDGWLIEVDSQEADRLAKHIKRYKLRAKFNVKLMTTEEMGVWSLWDNGKHGWTAHSMSSGGSGEKAGEIECEDQRAPGMGRRLLLPGSKKPQVDLEETDEAAYRIRRYLKGVPEGQYELVREHALPQESNIDFMGGIDYRKGCYVGQELTIRTHHTGVVRKRILPVMIYGQDEPIPESLEYLPDHGLDAANIPRETNFGRHKKKGRSAGKWLTGMGNIGLGLCRLEIMTNVLVQGEAGGFKEGDEFKLEWESDGSTQGVKAKAFIPSWHLTK